MNILFVCTGNTCRSPMAEGYLQSLINKSKNQVITVRSAGLFTNTGLHTSQQSIDVLKEYGVDISHLRSASIVDNDLPSFDKIIVMTSGHKMQIDNALPELKDKVTLLMDWTDQKGTDVGDPFGGDLIIYRKCFEQMKIALDNLFLELN